MGKKKQANNAGVDPASAIVWTDDDGIIHIRNSERGTLAKCPQRWWWGWREGLQPKETPKALWFGSALHEALADYYRPGIKRSKQYLDKFTEYADMQGEYVRTEVGDLDEDAWVDAKALGTQMLTGYVEHWGGDKDWDVIGTEQSFELEVPFFGKLDTIEAEEAFQAWISAGYRWQRGWGLDYFILNGTFDGVYRDKRDKRVKLMEHKSAASIWQPIAMDNQTGTYWLVAAAVGRQQGWMPKKEDLAYITYNFLRKGMPDTRPRNEKGMVTNLPTKQHFIDALDDHVVWPETARGAVKYPTVDAMRERAAELGITVIGEPSKKQPPPLYDRRPIRMGPANKIAQLRRIQEDVRHMTALVSGQLDVRKNAGRDTCPMCPFKEMCESHESGSDWTGVRDALFRRVDVYADHYTKSVTGS